MLNIVFLWISTTKLIQSSAIIMQSIFLIIFMKYTHSSLVWMRDVIYFVNSNMDLYSVKVSAVIYLISCNLDCIIMASDCISLKYKKIYASTKNKVTKDGQMIHSMLHSWATGGTFIIQSRSCFHYWCCRELPATMCPLFMVRFLKRSNPTA